jgi:hypothetical protein
MSVISVVKEWLNVLKEWFNIGLKCLKGWQTLVAAIAAFIAALIAWNAYRETVRQVDLTELSQARREEEEALRDFEALKSSIRRFGFLRKEMIALDSAKAKGTEKLEWWQIYSGWHERGLLAAEDRETVVAGHPSIDLERAAKALQTRMNAFSSVFHRDAEAAKDKSGPPQDIRAQLEAYAQNEFGAAAIKQLESDMYDLRLEFTRAFDECENKVGHYRQLWEQKRDRVKLLEKQVGR